MTSDAEIRDALQALLEAIKASDGARVASEMARLDEIVAREHGRLDPQLAHFLERRSYAKALMRLGGTTDIPTGACGERGN
jgi:hypothetical protein